MKLLLIFMLLSFGDFEEPSTIADLESRLRRDPADWQTSLNLAEIFLEQGNFGEVLNNLQRAQGLIDSLTPDSCQARLHFLWARFYDQQDNIPAALDSYTKTIECDSNYSEAWRQLAYLYEIFGNYERMLQCLQNSLRASGNPAVLLYDIGVTYDYLDSIPQAIASYNASLATGDLILEALLNLGVDWGLCGQTDSALYYFGRAREAGLESPELYYNLGIMTLESGNYEQAMNELMKSLTIDPQYSPSILQLARIYELTGDSGMARIYYEEFVKTAPIIYLDDIKAAREKLILLEQR